MISTMGAVAGHLPDAIRDAVREREDGAYEVTLQRRIRGLAGSLRADRAARPAHGHPRTSGVLGGTRKGGVRADGRSGSGLAGDSGEGDRRRRPDVGRRTPGEVGPAALPGGCRHPGVCATGQRQLRQRACRGAHPADGPPLVRRGIPQRIRHAGTQRGPSADRGHPGNSRTTALFSWVRFRRREARRPWPRTSFRGMPTR